MAGKRILYAEDEYTNRKLLEIQLHKYGVDCDLAQDGLAALEMFYKNHYDMVILDQYMPGMDGDKVAVRIRKKRPGIPLIAITSDDGEYSKLKHAGFNEIFIKPLRGQDYIQVIKSYLEKA